MKRALLAVVAAAALVGAAQAQPASKGPSFAFGTTGGNIRPTQIQIASSGRVLVAGKAVGVKVSAAKRQALLAYARKQGFFKLPKRTLCPGTLPDIASLYLAVTTGGKTTRVEVHGACNKSFDRVYTKVATSVPSVH